MIIQRRGFLIGLGSLLVAPSIVRAESLMPIKPLPASFYRAGAVFQIAMNSRGSYLWIARPGCEIYSPKMKLWRIAMFPQEMGIGDGVTVGTIYRTISGELEIPPCMDVIYEDRQSGLTMRRPQFSELALPLSSRLDKSADLGASVFPWPSVPPPADTMAD